MIKKRKDIEQLSEPEAPIAKPTLLHPLPASNKRGHKQKKVATNNVAPEAETLLPVQQI